MSTLINKIRFAALAAFTFLLLSCGGGGSGTSTDSDGVTTAGKGTVALLVTDAPTSDFKEIILTVIKVELLSDHGKYTLFEGKKTFDLLQLTDVTEIFTMGKVPSGTYNKIRLTNTQIELVPKDGSPSAYPKLPGNGKLDLNPRGEFYVGPYPLAIQLDFDAEKSIHVVETGQGQGQKQGVKYNFRPVVFIKIIENAFDTKLIRQRGVVKNLDGSTEEFDLCLIEAEVQPVSHDDTPDCVRVNTTKAPASIFDDHADPITFGDLENEDIVTVVGRLYFSSHAESSSKDDLSDDKYDDNSSDDDSSDDDIERKLILVAEIIWTGNDITQSDNMACSSVITDSKDTWYKNFELPVPEGSKCSDLASRPTILQPGSKIYDHKGNQLGNSSIDEGVLNTVDGYVNGGGDLKAVLVMLKLENLLNPLDQLTGVIGSVTVGTSLVLITDEGDRCVNFDSATTEVFEIILEEDGKFSFNQMSVFSLKSGQIADVFGTENNLGCLDADTIIYENNGAVIQPL